MLNGTALHHTSVFSSVMCVYCMYVCIYIPSLCPYQDMRKSTLCGICSHSRHSRSVLAGRGLASGRRAPRSLPIQAYLSTHTHTQLIPPWIQTSNFLITST